MSQISPVMPEALKLAIPGEVTRALQEDLGSAVTTGTFDASADVTAMLIPEHTQAHARVITREAGIFCGRQWVLETFQQLDPQVQLTWHVKDGEQLRPS